MTAIRAFGLFAAAVTLGGALALALWTASELF
jgi:hypothetical protein